MESTSTDGKRGRTMSAQQYPSERARKLVENYEMVALALDTLGAGELHDAEDLVLNYIASVERERDELRAASSSSTPLSETPGDTQRLNWLERRAEESGHVEINFTDAWSEPGGYGSVLSAGPREFWLRDSGDQSGPSLRAAIDAAISSSLAPLSEPTSEGT